MNTVFDSIVTIEDENDIVLQLENLQALLFEKKNVEDALREGVSAEILVELKEYAKNNKKKLEERDEVEEMLKNLIDEIKAISVVDITVAVIPAEGFCEKISNLIQEATGQRVVLNFKKDPQILGGAGIGYKGYYTEESLRKKLGEYWSKNLESRVQNSKLNA